MPDFTLETMQQCTKVRCSSEQWAPQGGCWPYRRSAKGYVHGQCKHMCGWHQTIGPAQTEEQRKQQVCPQCGSQTETVQVAV